MPGSDPLWLICRKTKKKKTTKKKPGWSRPRVQISVVVANIRTRPSKTEVEKCSVPTVIEHGAVGPKTRAKVFPKGAGSVNELLVVYLKENTEFKPVKLCLKTDLITHLASAEGLVNICVYICVCVCFNNQLEKQKQKLMAMLQMKEQEWVFIPSGDSPKNPVYRRKMDSEEIVLWKTNVLLQL